MEKNIHHINEESKYLRILTRVCYTGVLIMDDKNKYFFNNPTVYDLHILTSFEKYKYGNNKKYNNFIEGKMLTKFKGKRIFKLTSKALALINYFYPSAASYYCENFPDVSDRYSPDDVARFYKKAVCQNLILNQAVSFATDTNLVLTNRVLNTHFVNENYPRFFSARDIKNKYSINDKIITQSKSIGAMINQYYVFNIFVESNLFKYKSLIETKYKIALEILFNKKENEIMQIILTDNLDLLTKTMIKYDEIDAKKAYNIKASTEGKAYKLFDKIHVLQTNDLGEKMFRLLGASVDIVDKINFYYTHNKIKTFNTPNTAVYDCKLQDGTSFVSVVDCDMKRIRELRKWISINPEKSIILVLKGYEKVIYDYFKYYDMEEWIIIKTIDIDTVKDYIEEQDRRNEIRERQMKDKNNEKTDGYDDYDYDDEDD